MNTNAMALPMTKCAYMSLVRLWKRLKKKNETKNQSDANKHWKIGLVNTIY